MLSREIALKNNRYYYFIQKAHSTEQTHFIRVFSSGTHFTTESIEAMKIVLLKDTTY